MEFGNQAKGLTEELPLSSQVAAVELGLDVVSSKV